MASEVLTSENMPKRIIPKSLGKLIKMNLKMKENHLNASLSNTRKTSFDIKYIDLLSIDALKENILNEIIEQLDTNAASKENVSYFTYHV